MSLELSNSLDLGRLVDAMNKIARALEEANTLTREQKKGS